MKNVKKGFLIFCASIMAVSSPVLAAGKKFEFKFTDFDNHEYATTWTKENSANAYTITLNRYNGTTKNTMSSTNIFGCRMKDLSVEPVVDVYHTFSNYVTDYPVGYTGKVYQGDRMRIRGKKDSASSSSKALNISGTVIP